MKECQKASLHKLEIVASPEFEFCRMHKFSRISGQGGGYIYNNVLCILNLIKQKILNVLTTKEKEIKWV